MRNIMFCAWLFFISLSLASAGKCTYLINTVGHTSAAFAALLSAAMAATVAAVLLFFVARSYKEEIDGLSARYCSSNRPNSYRRGSDRRFCVPRAEAHDSEADRAMSAPKAVDSRLE